MPKPKARKKEASPIPETERLRALAPADPAAALAEKVRDLVRLARDQGQLTFEDVGRF